MLSRLELASAGPACWTPTNILRWYCRTGRMLTREMFLALTRQPVLCIVAGQMTTAVGPDYRCMYQAISSPVMKRECVCLLYRPNCHVCSRVRVPRTAARWQNTCRPELNTPEQSKIQYPTEAGSETSGYRLYSLPSGRDPCPTRARHGPTSRRQRVRPLRNGLEACRGVHCLLLGL